MLPLIPRASTGLTPSRHQSQRNRVLKRRSLEYKSNFKNPILKANPHLRHITKDLLKRKTSSPLLPAPSWVTFVTGQAPFVRAIFTASFQVGAGGIWLGNLMTYLKSPLGLPQLGAKAKLLRIRAQDVLPSGSCTLSNNRGALMPGQSYL